MVVAEVVVVLRFSVGVALFCEGFWPAPVLLVCLRVFGEWRCLLESSLFWDFGSLPEATRQQVTDHNSDPALLVTTSSSQACAALNL